MIKTSYYVQACSRCKQLDFCSLEDCDTLPVIQTVKSNYLSKVSVRGQPPKTFFPTESHKEYVTSYGSWMGGKV